MRIRPTESFLRITHYALRITHYLSHRLRLLRLVEDAEQLGLVEDHLLAGHADDVVDARQLDRVHRAGLLAHAAVDAAQLVDVELGRVLLAVGPGGLGSLD